MQRIFMPLIVLVCCVFAVERFIVEPVDVDNQKLATQTNTASSHIASLFANKQSNQQVQGIGKVIKILPDDNKGSRHQRFILQVERQTILVAHNIDLAAKITQLKVGDRVEFSGEYEWNAKGGVLHWTHHDPRQRHPNGWLKHNGKIYQ